MKQYFLSYSGEKDCYYITPGALRIYREDGQSDDDFRLKAIKAFDEKIKERRYDPTIQIIKTEFV